MKVSEIISNEKSKIEALASSQISAIEAKKKEDSEVFDKIEAANLAEVGQARDEGYDLGQKDAGVPADGKKYTEEDLIKDREEQKAIHDAAAKVLLDEVRVGLDQANAKIADLEAKAVDLKQYKLGIAAKLKNAAIDNQLVVDELEAE